MRSGEVAATPLSWPPRRNCAVDDRVKVQSATWPATTSVSACEVERYGTCSRSTPVASAMATPIRWPSEPTPDDAKVNGLLFSLALLLAVAMNSWSVLMPDDGVAASATGAPAT